MVKPDLTPEPPQNPPEPTRKELDMISPQHPTTAEKERYLVIGSSAHLYVDSIEWLTEEFPNIPDYDVVVVNMRSLSKEVLRKIDVKNVETLRRDLIRFLVSGGRLVILTAPTVGVTRGETHFMGFRMPANMTNLIWLPILIELILETGKSIEAKDDANFPKYMQRFGRSLPWQYYFETSKISPGPELILHYRIGGGENRIEFIPHPYATNRYGKMLAGGISGRVYLPKRKYLGHQTYVPDSRDTPDVILGDIVLLPLIPDVDDRAAVGMVLEELTGKLQMELPPRWAERIVIPGVMKRAKQLSHLEQEVNELRKKADLIKSEIEELNEYRKLLYGTGIELQDLFRKCIEKLGGIIIPARYSKEEYILDYKGKEYLVEVKGNSKSVSLDDVRQLNDYLLKYEEDCGKKCTGILFGNAWRNVPVEERDTREKPYFPQNVIERAEQLDIGLVSSKEFFQSYCAFLDGKKWPESFLDALTSQIGVVELNPKGRRVRQKK